MGNIWELNLLQSALIIYCVLLHWTHPVCLWVTVSLWVQKLYFALDLAMGLFGLGKGFEKIDSEAYKIGFPRESLTVGPTLSDFHQVFSLFAVKQKCESADVLPTSASLFSFFGVFQTTAFCKSWENRQWAQRYPSFSATFCNPNIP